MWNLFFHMRYAILYRNLLCFLEMKMWTLYFAYAMRLFIHNVTVLFGDEMSLIFPGLIKILSFYRRKGNRKNYFTHNFSRWIVPYFLDHINSWNFIRGRVMIFHIMISHKYYIAIGDLRVISDSVKFQRVHII